MKNITISHNTRNDYRILTTLRRALKILAQKTQLDLSKSEPPVFESCESMCLTIQITAVVSDEFNFPRCGIARDIVSHFRVDFRGAQISCVIRKTSGKVVDICRF